MSVAYADRRFWWDVGRPADAAVEPLRAVIFDLDGAVAELERDGQRPAFNAAFAAHGLDVRWTVQEYGRLVCIGDERRCIASALRRSGFGRVSAEIASHVQRTKNDLFEELVLRGDVAPRAGLDDLVNSLYFAGIPVAVVSNGDRSWVDRLVKQLIGDGIVETVVTADDFTAPGRTPDLYGRALWELGLAPELALAVAGTPLGLRTARTAKLATLAVPTEYTIAGHFTGAAEVRCGYDGLLAADCEAMHRRWWAGR